MPELDFGRRFWGLGRAARAKDDIKDRRPAPLTPTEEAPCLKIGRIVEAMPPEIEKTMLKE